jgi:hypothetical protein
MQNIYGTLRWRVTRSRALARDGKRCTVSRLLGGSCTPGPLHAHHIHAIEDGGDPFDLDNVGTTCAAHHPMWESLRRLLVRKMLGQDEQPIRCPHAHRSAEARRICEARIARQRQRAVAA